MTDTRKEFEQWFLANQLDFDCEIESAHYYDLLTTWHACQSLNDKRIEQLLAVIAKKDEALQACSDAMEYMSEYDIPLTLAEDTDKALAIKPEDVELVEVERVRIIDGIPTLCSSKSSSGEPAYTIKTKANTK